MKSHTSITFISSEQDSSSMTASRAKWNREMRYLGENFFRELVKGMTTIPISTCCKSILTRSIAAKILKLTFPLRFPNQAFFNLIFKVDFLENEVVCCVTASNTGFTVTCEKTFKIYQKSNLFLNRLGDTSVSVS